MVRRKTIFVIKFVHSITFLFMIACLAYILYYAIAGMNDWTFLAALAVIFLEVLAIFLNRWRCLLTSLTEKRGAASGAVTNIFLPRWLANYVKNRLRPDSYLACLAGMGLF